MLKSLKEYLKHFKHLKLSHFMSTSVHLCGEKTFSGAGVSINDSHHLLLWVLGFLCHGQNTTVGYSGVIL